MGNFLIIGANSFIAQAYQSYCLKNHISVITTSRNPDGEQWNFDLANDLSIDLLIEKIKKADISVVLVCAAITNNMACSDNIELSQQINVKNTSLLLSKLNRCGVFSIFLSSSQVFNHQKPNINWQSAYSPVTLYGQQKVEVENFIQANHLNTAIVRLTKVIGQNFPLFKDVINKAKNKQGICLFDDYCAAPVSISYVVKFLASIAKHKTKGVYQLSGAEDLSYAQMAERLLIYLKLNADVNKVSAKTKNISPVPYGSLASYTPLKESFQNQTFDDLLLTTYFDGAFHVN